MEPLTIGQVARRAGVSVETIRFYERQGLVAAPARRPSGYRQYPASVVPRIRFIRRSKALGFTLKEIGELLDLRVDPRTSCADIQARANAKVRDIEQRIRRLTQMQSALTHLAARCSGDGPVGECPILEALDQERAGADEPDPSKDADDGE